MNTQQSSLKAVVFDVDGTLLDSVDIHARAWVDAFAEFGHEVRAFATAEEYLAANHGDQTKCLILDVTLPGMSGPDLQNELRRRGRDLPIIFITARTDDTLRPRLLANGAVDVLSKPFSERAIEAALRAALGTD